MRKMIRARHLHILRQLLGLQLVIVRTPDDGIVYTFAEINAQGEGASRIRLYQTIAEARLEIAYYGLAMESVYVCFPFATLHKKESLWLRVKRSVTLALGFSPLRPAMSLQSLYLQLPSQKMHHCLQTHAQRPADLPENQSPLWQNMHPPIVH